MKLTIGKKLIGSFLIIAILLGITSAISSYYLQKIDEADTDLIERRAVILSNVQKIQVEMSKETSRLRGYLLTREQEFSNGVHTSYDASTSLIRETRSLSQIKELQEGLQALEELNHEFKQKYDRLFTMVQSNQSEIELMDYYKQEVLPLGRLLDSQVEKLATYQLQSMNEASKRNTALVDSAIANVASLSVFAFVLAILIGYFSSRMITKPIVAIAKVAERIASGDLTVEDIRVKNRDEIGNLAISFKQMADNLRDLVRQISISSEHVVMSSEELTASAGQSSKATETITLTIQEISANTEKQSQSVQESVVAINEMSSGIQQIASSAQMTSSLSVQTSQKALEGNRAIQTTVKQMDSIHSTMNHLAKSVREMEGHSKGIAQIVEVISDISAQTNLLALNAAIESARAGEQGRGFAVVADEVRKLAEQSTQSAEKIAHLVTTIESYTHKVVESMEAGVKEVNEGIQVVHAAGQLFEDIKQNIDEVSGQVQEISAASQQISASTEQVIHSIEEISEGSKHIASESQNVSASAEEQLASMEEITSSSASLTKMAEELQDTVGKFNV
ncbi:methyl-accepting chemotaxis protein [Brevibacillus choshinensis]|uniref:Methyl-accepting chemotaxis protein n=1 Tax=Brevibacillus choshinensis TaxID=54911 RepID=A0ABX7FJN1_BRECH|nr:methyl-accepting chemotaxis protein [Brevibacillus choshinensis]QRG66423.1 methyl-accepting chemotaxis protein [Brevibacillus choshinensis]